MATRRQGEGRITANACASASDQDFFGQENSPWRSAMVTQIKTQSLPLK
jgi:hypothetical protein